MRHHVKRALCLLVSLSILLTLVSILTLSTTAVIGSPEPMIAIGNQFVIVQDANGKLWGWGDNTNGVLGTAYSPQTGTAITSPIQLDLPSNVTSVYVSAGHDHVLMLASDGCVYAWGNNEYGQLGIDNGGAMITSPTLVSALQNKDIVAVATGTRFSLALSRSGQIYSFGINNHLQLGYALENGADYSTTPKLIAAPALENVVITKIHAGVSSASAIDEGGKVYLWGATENYILGTNDQNIDAEPFALPETKTTTPILDVALSSTHSAFLLNDGTVGFMGLNTYGQYGNKATENTPSKRFRITDTSALHVSDIAASDGQTVLLSSDGTVYTAGARIANDETSASNTFIPLFTKSEQSPVAIAIATKYQNGAMIARDGSVWVWGNNSYGQLANGFIGEGSASPVQVCEQSGSRFKMDVEQPKPEEPPTTEETPTTEELPTTEETPTTEEPPKPEEPPIIEDTTTEETPDVPQDTPPEITTSVLAPTYAIEIPATVNVGELRKTEDTNSNTSSFTKFTVSVKDIADFYGEKEIRVSVSSKNADGIFCLQDQNGNILPFDILTVMDVQTAIHSGDLLASFRENGTTDAWICIDQSKMIESGIYQGILVFSFTLVDLNE